MTTSLGIAPLDDLHGKIQTFFSVFQPDKDRHPFSLFVDLQREGDDLPPLIDPDIKNPST